MLQPEPVPTTQNQTRKSKRSWGFFLALGLVALTLCAVMAAVFILPAQFGKSRPSFPPSPSPFPLLAQGPTATPFRPLRPTGTYFPTPTPTFTPTPPPTPTPMFGGRVVGVLLGSDRRPHDQGPYYRTDTIILAIYNPETGALSLVSIPRDLYVYIPGVGYNRINVAMEFGGFDLLAETIAQNLGPRPQYYVMVDLYHFKKALEVLGGIEVDVPQRYCDRWPKGGYRCVEPGRQWMDPDVALWYARARKSSNDFSRMKRQQLVVQAILRRLMDMRALQQAPRLYALFREMVETNVGPGDIPHLLWQFRRFRMENVATFVIEPPYVRPWIKPDTGAYVLLPDREAIQSLLMEAFSR